MLLPVKSNVAPGDIGGLIYRIAGKTIAGNIETSCIEWIGQTDIEANEVLSQQQARIRSSKLMDAMEFLKQQLENGPKRQAEIMELGEAQSHAPRTIKRAKKELKLVSHKDRFSGGWKWYTAEQFAQIEAQEK